MTEPQHHPPAVALALAWQPHASRPALAALFDLDLRLAGVVARAKEPLLAQMRLAWWRDRLGAIADENVAGEPLLATLQAQWGARAEALTVLADGWEGLLGAAPLPAEPIAAFAAARGAALAAFADLVGALGDADAVGAAGRSWALADLAWRTSDASERELAFEAAKSVPPLAIASRSLRGVAVLGGLARRALLRGEPMLHGRGAALAAIRLGMFGR